MKSNLIQSSLQSLAVMAALLTVTTAAPETKGSAKDAATPEVKAPIVKLPVNAAEMFGTYLTKGRPVMGEIGAIVPPKEINKYISKVQAAAQEDPEWHKEFAKKSKPGLPLPWNDKLGLTKDEYEEYLKFWDQRQFKAAQEVVIRLEEPTPGEWMIRVSGVGMPISLLRYSPATDVFKSTNGVLKRIEDIDAPARSILGAWKGKEWRFEEKTDFVWTKENIALGKYKDGKHCLLIYRIQENITNYDKSLVIRFAAPAAGK